MLLQGSGGPGVLPTTDQGGISGVSPQEPFTTAQVHQQFTLSAGLTLQELIAPVTGFTGTFTASIVRVSDSVLMSSAVLTNPVSGFNTWTMPTAVLAATTYRLDLVASTGTPCRAANNILGNSNFGKVSASTNLTYGALPGTSFACKVPFTLRGF